MKADERLTKLLDNGIASGAITPEDRATLEFAVGLASSLDPANLPAVALKYILHAREMHP